MGVLVRGVLSGGFGPGGFVGGFMSGGFCPDTVLGAFAWTLNLKPAAFFCKSDVDLAD